MTKTPKNQWITETAVPQKVPNSMIMTLAFKFAFIQVFHMVLPN